MAGFRLFKRRSKRKKRQLSKLMHVGRPNTRVTARRPFSARTSIKVAKHHMNKRISRFITPRFLLICMSITLAGICIGIIFFSSFFVTSDIVVIRDKVFVEPQKIEMAMRPVIGKNIFTVDESQIQRELEQMFPTIQRVEVHKLYPRSIQVRVFSWPMVAQVNYKDASGTGFLLSENGYIVPNVLVQEETQNEEEETEKRELMKLVIPRYSTADPEQVPLLTLTKLEAGRNFIDQPLLNRLRFALDVYEKNFQEPVSFVEFLPFEKEVHLHLKSKTIVMIWLDSDIETQLFKLKTTEPKMSLDNGSLSYVDLRIKDKVFTCATNTACSEKVATPKSG